MSAPYSNLASKLEKASVAYITPLIAGLGATTEPGQSTDTKQPPLVACVADTDSAEEEPPFTGNYWLEFGVFVKVMAPTDADGVSPKAANDTLVATVFDAFNTSTLAASLSSAGITDFTVIAAIPRGPQFQVEGDAWINSFHFRVYCCAKSL